MFEITPEHIALLNDTDLRTLVGLLCEAELRDRQLPASNVTSGGNQNAGDGGVDVRVALPSDTTIAGFIPRPATVFQVKAQDMPRSAIEAEMRPRGTPRRVLIELADAGGAYVIVSSLGSVADSALADRLAAMNAVVAGIPDCENLKLDFYDRTRLATWVRGFPGLIIWVRDRIGSALSGWKPYSAWARDPDGLSGEYLLDDNIRIVRPGKGEISALAGLEALRSQLRGCGKVVRLVGLSGVGKTRLVQALFDDRVGANALDADRVAYCDLSDPPEPSPGQLLTELIASRSRALVIVDNCPPSLHRALTEICQQSGSTVSLVTIEYDIQEDQPEGTEVYELRPSSAELIERLIRRRYDNIGQPVACRIAGMAGGNARVALALAATVQRGEPVIRLTDAELFDRLFRQRRDADTALMRAAQICSIVYSFDGEDDSDTGELSSLARIANLGVSDLHTHVAEMRRRELVQTRGRWRAVMPQAIANKLGTLALENLPRARVREAFSAFQSRLQISFCRRIGMLSDSAEARQFASELVEVGGALGEVGRLGDVGLTMLEHLTPACPSDVLAAIRRSVPYPFSSEHRKVFTLLRLLAYDPELFDNSIELLIRGVLESGSSTSSKDRLGALSSLFTVVWPGTHASLQQRLRVILRLLSGTDAEFDVGVAALKAALQGSHFSPMLLREFGSRKRDYGAHPRTKEEVEEWFNNVVSAVTPIALEEGKRGKAVRSAIASRFRDVWTYAKAFDAIEQICRSVRSAFFWREGWLNVRFIQHFDSAGFEPEIVQRLNALETILRPTTLVEDIRALVINAYHGGVDLIDVGNVEPAERYSQLEQRATEYGKAVGTDLATLEELLPDLLSADGRTWSFGRGIARTCDPAHMWSKLVEAFATMAPNQRNPHLLSGFMHELASRDRSAADVILESSLTDERVVAWLPSLESAAGLSAVGVRRLVAGMQSGAVPVHRFKALVGGDSTASLTPDLFSELVNAVIGAGGVDIAFDMLWMKLHGERTRDGHSGATIALGRDLLSRVEIARSTPHEDHVYGAVALVCLAGIEGAEVARDVCRKLRDAIVEEGVHATYYDAFIAGVFRAAPVVAVDTFLSDGLQDIALGRTIFELLSIRCNPLSGVADEDLLAWSSLNPERRLPVLASVIPISPSLDGEGPRQWSGISIKLLEASTVPSEILSRYAERLRPMSWVGSRSAVMQANAELLDQMPFQGDAAFQESFCSIRSRTRAEIEQMRRWEQGQDRVEERFE